MCETGIIKDEIECKNAVESFGYITIANKYEVEDGSWVITESDRPKGCYLNEFTGFNKFLHFNKADTYADCDDCRPICRQGKPHISQK